MWLSPAERKMGERCLRSVSVKTRTDWIDAALGVRVVLLVVDLGMLDGEGVGSSNLTRLFVVFIAPDAVAVVIIDFSRTIEICGAN